MAQTSLDRLSERTGINRSGRQIGRVTVLRLSAYYAAALALTGLGVWLTAGPVPQVPGWTPGQAVGELVFVNPLRLLRDGVIAVLGAFMLSAPVAFVYVRTRSSLKYDRSLVQTVIMLPVVVTAILIVVQNSLALAFALGGIVAAVRFKNDLEDARDAVYIFAAVGIGFAAGVRQLPIAAFLSVIFAVLELLLWKFDLTADHEQTFGLLCEPGGAAAVAAPEARAASRPEAAPTAAHQAAPPPPAAEPEVRERGLRRGERLRVYVTAAPTVRAIVERVLDRSSKRWKLVDQRAGGVDQVVLDYDLRLRHDDVPDQVIERLYSEAGVDVIGAEVLPRTAAS